MDERESPVGQRFQAERNRLRLGVQETADACGVTRNAISKIERAGVMPSGAVLQGFARQGADVQFVLLGRRAAEIDLTTLGVVEQALANRYRVMRGESAQPERIRGRVVALAYNQLLAQLSPAADVGHLAAAIAELTLASLDDPHEPGLLERNLLRPVVPAATAIPQGDRTEINVSGQGHKVAGRDLIQGGKGKKG